MNIPIFLLAFIIFIIFIKLKMSQVDQSTKNIRKNFWKKEEDSMFVRKKSLDSLDYIRIDSKSLPLLSKEECNEDIYIAQGKVLELIQLQIVNFHGKTNTDLKLEYGTANLNTLIMYEDHYNMLIKELYKWANLLYENDKMGEAITVLEVGVTIKTDISNHYILLGKLYKLRNDTHSFNALYNKINETDFILKSKVLNTMNSL